MQRSLKLAQDEAVIAAAELLAVVVSHKDFVKAEEVFEEAGATFARKSRQFAPAVDRPVGLRAR